MFEPLPAKFDFVESEKDVLGFWERADIFQKSLDQHADAERFVFYEGPPTANGLPHPGHCLTRAMKDLFPRYQTMCGKLVERKAGWDTHGLPVEVEVCKELGIHTKEDIEAYGVEKFVRLCIESVFRYTREWEEMTKRLGFWVNLDEAYVTFHQSYVESVWWGLKTLFERGLLYQGHKVVWWWAQGGTALSAGEVGEGYRTVDDPSVYVRFGLISEPEAEARGILGSSDEATKRRSDGGKDEEEPQASARTAHRTGEPAQVGEPSGLKSGAPHCALPADAKVSLLVWTTTPWTLISNHFAAVGPDIDYALMHDKTTGEYLYIASALVQDVADKAKHEFEAVGVCKGSDLVGLRYVPPFDVFHKLRKPSSNVFTLPSSLLEQPVLAAAEDTDLGNTRTKLKDGGLEYVGWRVLDADFVATDTGTGIVHLAPAYGEVDFERLQQERDKFDRFSQVPLINAVEPDGNFADFAPEAYRGRWVKDCDKDIIREMKERGILYHQGTVRHEYPFCPRAEDDPLIQYARKSWFVRTSEYKDEFLKNNAGINWLPEHIKEGRFGDFLRNNVDWALSRERFWGTPLPVWVCEKCGKMEAIGSLTELKAKPGATDGGMWEQKKAEDPELPDHLQVHKPYIDEWTYLSACCAGGRDGGTEGRRDEGKDNDKDAPRMRRVPEVIDCWWDAGSMPFAQWGFPHQPGSMEKFASAFPANFISEALDQTRGWFYGLLAISTLLFREGGTGVSPVVSSGASPTLSIRHRNLPHWEAGGSTYFVTFRTSEGELTSEERDIVIKSCRHWDEKRVILHAAAIMPDHVHLLMTPMEKEPDVWWSLAELMHSIKSYTAHEIAKLRGRSGRVWLDESYDRIIRSASDFGEELQYILDNAERAGLRDDYRWLWLEPTHSNHRRDACATLQGEYPHPYKTCIVLGLMMGEDGLKMSKRKKNYKEPTWIFDHYGADALRWFLFSGQTPWTSVRFQEANIRDAHREFLVRLYNVFSFFNIYANIDGFEARSDEATKRRSDGGKDEDPSPRATGFRPVSERGELDRWIVSELHRTTRAVRESLDRFENYPATQKLNDLVDALSNWYVRRSRDRFWKSEKDQDKWDAYNTLYEVLVALSKLIAPFTPFFAETMYQNLRDGGTKGRRDEGLRPEACSAAAPESVHLCSYPTVDEDLIDEELAGEMELVRQVVSLGRAARTAAKLKVRQPLALAEIVLARQDFADWLGNHRELVADELNIKQIELAEDADQYVTYQVKPNFKAIGPKFGKLAKPVAAALAAMDPVEARAALASTGGIPLKVGAQDVRLTEAEVEVRLEAKPGWSAAQGRGGVVVVKTELTPELIEEGLIRELIHHVQQQRRQHDLAYEARITLQIAAPPELVDVVKRHSDVLERECLATRVEYTLPAGADAHEAKVEGHAVRLAIATL